MGKEEYYKVCLLFTYIFHCLPSTFQELFSKIDLEDDGIVYLKEIVIYLRAMNEDIDTNLEVGWGHLKHHSWGLGYEPSVGEGSSGSVWN